MTTPQTCPECRSANHNRCAGWALGDNDHELDCPCECRTVIRDVFKPDRRQVPRLIGKGRAYVTSWTDDSQHHGITDGEETVEFATSVEAVLAAKVHNLVNKHEDNPAAKESAA